MPKVVAHAVKIIAEAEAGASAERLEVLHALDLIAKGTPDVLLIQAIADGSHGATVLITTDKSMRTRQHERAAFTETGCIGIVLRQGWNHASMWERARYSLLWWSAWVETVRDAKLGTLWECPWSQRPKKLKPF
jgi:hypothetical protein